ncbi:MAG: hypothetical protein ACE5ID_09635, partial [Acidobacteriota bacterium]
RGADWHVPSMGPPDKKHEIENDRIRAWHGRGHSMSGSGHGKPEIKRKRKEYLTRCLGDGEFPRGS